MWRNQSCGNISPHARFLHISPQTHFAPNLSCEEFSLCDRFSSHFSCGETSPHDNLSYRKISPHDRFFLHKHRLWCLRQISGLTIPYPYFWLQQNLEACRPGRAEPCWKPSTLASPALALWMELSHLDGTYLHQQQENTKYRYHLSVGRLALRAPSSLGWNTQLVATCAQVSSIRFSSKPLSSRLWPRLMIVH